jgi:hypothetical protein
VTILRQFTTVGSVIRTSQFLERISRLTVLRSCDSALGWQLPGDWINTRESLDGRLLLDCLRVVFMVLGLIAVMQVLVAG